MAIVVSVLYPFFSKIASTSLMTIWQAKRSIHQIQGRVFATLQIATTLFFPQEKILAGPLSKYVSQSLLEVNRVLVSSLDQIIHTLKM